MIYIVPILNNHIDSDIELTTDAQYLNVGLEVHVSTEFVCYTLCIHCEQLAYKHGKKVET